MGNIEYYKESTHFHSRKFTVKIKDFDDLKRSLKHLMQSNLGMLGFKTFPAAQSFFLNELSYDHS